MNPGIRVIYQMLNGFRFGIEGCCWFAINRKGRRAEEQWNRILATRIRGGTVPLFRTISQLPADEITFFFEKVFIGAYGF